VSFFIVKIFSFFHSHYFINERAKNGTQGATQNSQSWLKAAVCAKKATKLFSRCSYSFSFYHLGYFLLIKKLNISQFQHNQEK